MNNERIQTIPLTARVVSRELPGLDPQSVDILTVPMVPPADVTVPESVAATLSFHQGRVRGWKRRPYDARLLYWIAVGVADARVEEKNFGFRKARLAAFEEELIEMLPSRPLLKRIGDWVRELTSPIAQVYRAEWVDHQTGTMGYYFIVQDPLQDSFLLVRATSPRRANTLFGARAAG